MTTKSLRYRCQPKGGWRALVYATACLAAAPVAHAQQREPEPLALFEVAFYGRGANSLEPGDPGVALLTDSILRSELAGRSEFTLLDKTRLSRDLAGADRSGIACLTLECRRAVSERLGAKWMVTAKLSKTSNLIWYLSGQLTDVTSGRRLLDDEFELKGIAKDIATGGARVLARRIGSAAASQVVVDTPAVRINLAELKRRLGAATEESPPNLSKVNLSGLDLSGIDFKRANLAGSWLAGTKLVGANLFTSDLTDAVLPDADLSRANMDGTVLRRSNLQRANLEGASLFATILEGADLSGANLSGTRIIGYLRSANLSGASLRNANAGADPGNQSMGVMRATFVGANLSSADLTGANLYKADLSHASLVNARLAGANLANADLIQTDFTRADLTGVKMPKANLEGANFSGIVGRAQIQGLAAARNSDKATFDVQ